MNADIHLEHRAGSSQGKHEGEPSLGLCDRLNRTRDNSQRQLPTDHDYAVPTREYQTDQSSLKSAPTAARSVFGKGKQRQRQKQPHCCAELTRSLHIRPMRSASHSFRGLLGLVPLSTLLLNIFVGCWSYRDCCEKVSRRPSSCSCLHVHSATASVQELRPSALRSELAFRALRVSDLSVPGHTLRCGPETSVTSPLRCLWFELSGF